MWKAERPRSANSLADAFSSLADWKKCQKSSAFPSWQEFSGKNRSDTKERSLIDMRDFNCCCWCRLLRSECCSLPSLNSRCRSCSGLQEKQYESWNRYNHSSRSRKKFRSNSNFAKTATKKIFDDETEFHKVKRSLRLLGLELSDFGILSGREEKPSRKKPEEKPASFSTKITNRSISLDSLRTAVKRAWIADRLDESHRRLLAQAAYEEWYFKKERELKIKQNEDKLTRLKAKENLRDHFQRKKEKSEEEFKKWLNRKRTKTKENEKNLPENRKNSNEKLTKTKEESEKAFSKWKKSKEEEFRKREKEKKKEEERRIKSEKEKHNKKIVSEKAFQQWLTKLKETQELNEAKLWKQKKRQELQERRQREEGSKISFEVWKAAKDEQIKERTRQMRKAHKIAREERLVQMEERIYEAEQAFEEWLEKVDNRKQSQCSAINNYIKTVPWIPA